MRKAIINHRIIRFISHEWQNIKVIKGYNDIDRLNREYFIIENTYDSICNNLINL